METLFKIESLFKRAVRFVNNTRDDSVIFIRKLYNGLFISVLLATILGGLFAVASFTMIGLGFAYYMSVNISNQNFQFLFYLSLFVLCLSGLGIYFSYSKFAWNENRPFRQSHELANQKSFLPIPSAQWELYQHERDFERRWNNLAEATRLITEAIKELSEESASGRTIKVNIKKPV